MINEDGFTKEDVENCIAYIFDAPIPDPYAAIIIDALEFYKDTQYIG